MNSPSNPPVPTGTVVVPSLASEGRDVASVRSQKNALLDQLRSASGEPSALTPEALLARWPTNPATDQDAASLIFEDFCRRRQEDPGVSLADYQQRFPEHRESLASLVRQEAFLKSLGGSEASSPRFSLPDVGDRLFGFRLLHELGRGSFARVFLASQDELASRPVVLKVSNVEGDEPQTMALLQHTHIVPIHSVHEDRKAGLRAVCMPYFGGASLSAVLKQAGVGRVAVRSGELLVRALQAVQAPLPIPEPVCCTGEIDAGPVCCTGEIDAGPVCCTGEIDAGPVCCTGEIDAGPVCCTGEIKEGEPLPTSGDPKVLALLRGYSYPQAAAWVVARLAEGLQHSHSRGVLHRDIKPSNVLLGMDGQPMLLDFNLAQVNRGNNVKVVLGGTINYMAPEHLRSLAARDLAVARHVDHRADIYSLGMVLFEMLVGRGPFAESASYTPLPLLVEAMAVERGRGAPSLRRVLPNAPWDLESILRKCLAPAPADRYQQAEHVAEDLQRFLDDRPLRFAPELSLRERCRKWRRRHPRVATAGVVSTAAAVLLTTLGAALVGSQSLLATAQSQLGQTREHLDRARAAECRRAFRAGTIGALCLVNTTTDGQDQLRLGLAACEKTLGLYQILQRDDWQEQPAWRLLGGQKRETAEDARELLLLLAWAHAETAPGDRGALRKALSLLDRCEAVAGLPPSRALWEDRGTYLERLGESDRARAARARAAAIRPGCARDHYLLAISLARAGRYAEAVAELNTALGLNPDHYWSLVQRGICYREQGELMLAAADFSRCTGLEPGFAWGHYNLACVLDQNKKHREAIRSYDNALRCDRGFALAYLNRGLAWLDLRQFEAALADLDRAAGRGRQDALLHLGRGTALEALGRAGPADAAFALALGKLDALPPARQATLLCGYGFAVYKRLPDAALRAFGRVLARQAHHPRALYGKAMVLAEEKNIPGAVACFDEALAWHPGFVDARRFRAVLHARMGRLDAAVKDITHCLGKERSGITLYAAACVQALVAAASPEPAARRGLEDQALAFLEAAFRQGYGLAGAADDPDLRAVRQRPEFAALLRRRPPP
jgi:serine/threonine protein kinase/Flp pilus assembly protein TadD